LLQNSEPYIAIDPQNPHNLVAAWMSVTLGTGNIITIKTRASFDGGATWSQPKALPHMGQRWQSADVSMAWKRNGALYLAYIDYLDNTSTDGGVFVTRSDNGGLDWSTPVKAIDAAANSDVSVDRPWIVVDNSTASTFGNLYITTKPAPWNALPNHPYFTRSIDDGKTWTPDVTLDPAPYSASLIPAPMPTPAVASDGTLYILYPSYDISQGNHAGFTLCKSIDGGASFMHEFGFTPSPEANAKDSAKQGYRLVADPTNGQRLFFCWGDGRNGDADIYGSMYDGAWSTPTRINDDAKGNGVEQDMMWPSFAPNGTLAVVWRDRRNGTGSGYASGSQTYYATSSDGGKTWSKNTGLSDVIAPYDTILNYPGNDFMSAAISNDSLYAVWADTRAGKLQIYFGKAALGEKNWVSVMPLSSDDLQLAATTTQSTLAVSFKLDAASHFTLEVLDENGKRWRSIEGIASINKQEMTIPVEDLSRGCYLVRLEIESGAAIRKIVLP